MGTILLFTGKADPGPFIKHPHWIPFAILGAVVSLVLGVYYARLRAIYFRRYRVVRDTWLPASVAEVINAQFNTQHSYTRDTFAALWKQQPESDLERLRRGALVCLAAGYAAWGTTAFVIIPRLF